MLQILLSTLDLQSPVLPPVVPGGFLCWQAQMVACWLAGTLSVLDRDRRARLESGTLHPSTRRLDGYGRASEDVEDQAHGR